MRNGGEADNGDRQKATMAKTTGTALTSTNDDASVRSSKKVLRSSISATLKELSEEEMARQSEEILE